MEEKKINPTHQIFMMMLELLKSKNKEEKVKWKDIYKTLSFFRVDKDIANAVIKELENMELVKINGRGIQITYKRKEVNP